MVHPSLCADNTYAALGLSGVGDAHIFLRLKEAETAMAALPGLQKVVFVVGNEEENYYNSNFKTMIRNSFPLLEEKKVLQ